MAGWVQIIYADRVIISKLDLVAAPPRAIPTVKGKPLKEGGGGGDGWFGDPPATPTSS